MNLKHSKNLLVSLVFMFLLLVSACATPKNDVSPAPTQASAPSTEAQVQSPTIEVSSAQATPSLAELLVGSKSIQVGKLEISLDKVQAFYEANPGGKNYQVFRVSFLIKIPKGGTTPEMLVPDFKFVERIEVRRFVNGAWEDLPFATDMQGGGGGGQGFDGTDVARSWSEEISKYTVADLPNTQPCIVEITAHFNPILGATEPTLFYFEFTPEDAVHSG